MIDNEDIVLRNNELQINRSKEQIFIDHQQLLIKPTEHDNQNQIGSLVRFSSYTASIGRLQLCQGINTLASLNTSDWSSQVKIVYTDTDSIYVDLFDRIEEEHEVLGCSDDQAYWLQTLKFFHKQDVSSLEKCDLELIAKSTKGLILNSLVYKNLN